MYWISAHDLRFAWPHALQPLTLADHFRHKVTKWMKSPIDWWPFSQGRQPCSEGYQRLLWEVHHAICISWQERQLWTDISTKAATRYRKETCVSLSDLPSQTTGTRLGPRQQNTSTGHFQHQRPQPTYHPTEQDISQAGSLVSGGSISTPSIYPTSKLKKGDILVYR